jgi:hypothetical protein
LSRCAALSAPPRWSWRSRSQNTLEGGWDLTATESLLIVLLAGFGALVAWCAWIWRRQGHRRHAAGGSAAAVTIVLGSAILVAIGGPERSRARHDVRATASDFRDARQDIDVDTTTEAQRMADNFIRCRTLTGLSKQEILRVLGRPDGTSATPQIDLGDAQYDYYLGAERSYISIDSETLEVRFGSDKTVGRVAIHRD